MLFRSYPTPIGEITEKHWDDLFGSNLKAPLFLSQAAAPALRLARGLIINIASAASFCTGPQMSIYNAAKAAVVGLSETLMQEYAEHGVQVTVAMPGFFRTRLIETARGTERTLAAARKQLDDSGIEAEEVAEAMLFAAARGRTHFVYPSQYAFLWRLKRAMPQRFQKLLPRLIKRRT